MYCIYGVGMRGNLNQYRKGAASCQSYDKAVLSDGAIPKKYKELIALAVALSGQCECCTEFYREQAQIMGISKQELEEVTQLACTLRADGPARHVHKPGFAMLGVF
jgi:AhpD family alkylhydroperoxidase